jgi:hypothetical protein
MVREFPKGAYEEKKWSQRTEKSVGAGGELFGVANRAKGERTG